MNNDDLYSNDPLDDEEECEEIDPKKQISEYREMKSKKEIEKVDNEHYDEAMVLNESDDNLAESKDNKDKFMMLKNSNKISEDDFTSSSPTNKASTVVPLPKFDYSEFDKLNTNPDYKQLMQYMNRFQPAEIQLDTKLKPFIPSYIPSIGEVDAFLKVPRPDKAQEELGLSVLDEPTIEGEHPDILCRKLIIKGKGNINPNLHIGSIQKAENSPNEIQDWIDKIGKLQKEKMSTSVPYSKNMPEMESLMQIWHEKMEQGLNEVKLPNESINLSSTNYAKIICNLLDIPIHKTNSNKSIIEALHVLFSLYSVVKENIGYKKSENVQLIKFN